MFSKLDTLMLLSIKPNFSVTFPEPQILIFSIFSQIYEDRI